MKIGISSYSFSSYRKAKKASCFDICDKAKELCFDGIEFIDLVPEGKNTFENRLALAKELRRHCEKIGLEIPAYTVGADLISDGADGTVQALFCCLEITRALGAKIMRHDVCFKLPDGWDYKDAIAAAVPRIRAVADKAAEMGITTCIENHGIIIQAPERVRELIEAVDRPNYRWLCDIGNFLCADCEPLASCKIAAEYTVHAHVKDFLFRGRDEIGKGGFNIITAADNALRGTVVGHGIVPVLDCIKALSDSGYDGYLSLEFEGPEEPEYALAAGAKNIMEFASALSK